MLIPNVTHVVTNSCSTLEIREYTKWKGVSVIGIDWLITCLKYRTKVSEIEFGVELSDLINNNGNQMSEEQTSQKNFSNINLNTVNCYTAYSGENTGGINYNSNTAGIVGNSNGNCEF